MDVLNGEHGNGSNGSQHFDVPKSSSNDTQLPNTSHSSRQNSISSSPPSDPESGSESDLAPESVVAEKDANKFSLQPKQGTGSDSSSPNLMSPPTQLPLWSVQSSSTSPQLQPPRIQVTLPGYDPNRIPASVFSSSKASTPMEWSVASNESLFSLHLGSTSFSRDQFIMLYRSGELPKVDDLIIASSNTATPTPSFPRFSNVAAETYANAVDLENESSSFEITKTTNSKPSQQPPVVVDYDQIPANRRTHSANHVSCRSDESYSSTRSFQFPVFVNAECGRIGSPIVDSRRHQALLLHPQPQPQPRMMQWREQSQGFETKPKSALTNWLSCFSYCCDGPCR